MVEMIYGCNSLKFADISSFIIEDNITLFTNLPEECVVKVNKKSYNKINDIPSSCEIIQIEDL